LMSDIVVVIVVLSACAAMGMPLCTLLPRDRFAVRFIIAPPLGLAVFAVAGTILYRDGVPPWLSMLVGAGAGLVVMGAWRLGANLPRSAVSSTSLAPVAAGTVAVLVLCLSPAWTGGAKFRIFQANVYDQMTFWAASVTVRTHDYASIVAQQSASLPDPVVERGGWFLGNRGVISVAHAAVADLSGRGAIDSTYAFLAALQVNFFFAALFILINVFSADYRLASFVGGALAVGFFPQYVFDINSWSELSSLPLYLLMVALVALAFDRRRLGSPGAVAGFAVIFGVLLGGLLYLYPENLAIYGTAAAAAAVTGLVVRKSGYGRAPSLAALGLGLCLALSLTLFFWSGTLGFLLRQYGKYGGLRPDWYHYFQGYLFGSEQNYVAVLFDAASSHAQIVNVWFSLPIESIIAGLGLYFLLPGASWPPALAVVWKIALYCFLAALVAGVIRAITRIWKASPDGSSARMIAACLAGCLLPAAIALAGYYWAAGKGLSMAAPMLFLLASTPLLDNSVTGGIGQLGRGASFLFVLAHFALGLLRPILVTEAVGSNLPGLPTAAAAVSQQKDALDWEEWRWAAELGKCHGVFLDLDNPVMLQLVRRAAVDLKVPWAASIRPIWPEEPSARPYLPKGWESFDCVASINPLAAKPGQTLIWLGRDRSIFDYLKAPHAELEFGVQAITGISLVGGYGIETTPQGALQWTARVARFGVPNNPAASARTLRLELWPMPLATKTLRITVNGLPLYDGVVPSGAVTVTLDKFASQNELGVELEASAATRYPNDPRELGVAIKELRLIK